MLTSLMRAPLLGALLLLTPIFHDVQAKDKTYARVSCPESVRVKLNFENKVGADPQFKISHDGPDYDLPLADSGIRVLLNASNHVDAFQCKYKLGMELGRQETTYEYKPKRKLATCKKLNAQTVECEVQ